LCILHSFRIYTSSPRCEVVMVVTGRIGRLALLVLTGVLLATTVVAPSYAHNDIVSTNTQCTGAGCNLATTTSVLETANLCVSIEGDCTPGTVVSNTCADTTTSAATQEGTLCFLVYKAPVYSAPGILTTTACNGNVPVSGSTQITSGISPTSTPVPRSDDTTTYTSYAFKSTLTLSASTTAGFYAWIVQYNPSKFDSKSGNSLYDLQTCETFQLTGTYPPPPTAPQFPLGMALLFALAIPGLLLIRSRYASKVSPLSV